jgi:acetoin utilization deacetylase AcuC-like enzyme
MEAGCDDQDYQLVHRAVIGPVLEQFRPQLLLVSAGYDAHARDPLASMRMTTEGYAWVIAQLAGIARRHGALALITEGGYEVTALAACLEASFDAIETSTALTAAPRPGLPSPAGGKSRADRAIASVRGALGRYWSSL